MLHKLTLFISPKQEYRLLGLMLFSLCLSLCWNLLSLPFPEIWLRIILLLHFITFTIWWFSWTKLEIYHLKESVLLALFIAIFIIFPHIWLITIWQITLIGIIGGRDLATTFDKVISVFSIVYLVIILLLINVNQIFFIENSFAIYQYLPIILPWLFYTLLFIPLILIFFTVDTRQNNRYHIDFFHGLSTTFFISIIILISLVLMLHNKTIMPLAVFQVILGFIIFILLTSWIWLLITGEKGISPLWVRHLYHIDNAFESWLEKIAQPSNYKNLTTQEFLQIGFKEMITLPWISGIEWNYLDDKEMLGYVDDKQVTIVIQSLEVIIYAPYHINSVHYFQVKILIQLLEYFHETKRRESAFAQKAHLQAIYETGAKLTHDIKNLLQSLHTITSIISTCSTTEFDDTQRMLQGQMPHLTQRLKRTLDKLQKPAEFTYSNVPVSLWWSNLNARYRKSKIKFISDLATENILIPEDLFDNVSENLIQNAVMKRKRETELQIIVSLKIDKRRLQLMVCDNGSAIPKEITDQLLTGPVESHDGYGIGLYQAVKQLANTGYVLKVAENEEGQVCFEFASTE
ncbi:MAG: hypothetical protein KAH84_03350 [Thiomargarita sp.]|nr:hypothetical protein [Thiomargarita sp.]